MSDDWDEDEYLEHLESERVNYAWTMQHYGGMSPTAAHAAALEFYAYEPPGTPYRGIHFNQEAWYWAADRITTDRGTDPRDFPAMPPEYPDHVDPASIQVNPDDLEALRRKLNGEQS